MDLEAYKKVQAVAKDVHRALGQYIYSESTEHSIAAKASELLVERGITDTWYYGVSAFVLLGSQSCTSISGKDYCPSHEAVGDTNLVTVDLSPMLDNVWGDCARSYFVEGGKCTSDPSRENFRSGEFVELELHSRMKKFVTPETRFSELYEFGNKQIEALGYENLDFLGNLGHSIETTLSRRRYIDKNCNEKIGNVRLFTFEPHIRKHGTCWGFKHENIYYFNGAGCAVEL